MRVKSGKNKTKQLVNQINVFKPKYTIPFASFCWFSHQENYYMNDAINKVDLIEKEDLNKIVNNFSKRIKSEVITLSTFEKKSVAQIKAKLISYVS